MTMEVANPVWNSKDCSYVFQLSGSYFSVGGPISHSSPGVPFKAPVLTDALITSFLDEFVGKTSKHFSTQLRTSIILSRLKHVWTQPTLDLTDKSYRVEWTPKEMIVKSKEFCLVWTSVAKETEPVISSDFLNLAPSRSSSPAPAETKDLRTIQLQAQTGLVEHEIPMSADLSDPRMTLEYENSPHSAEKKRIREARLRAALANLRAERLTEKYYQKYGTPAEDDSSGLSSDSEDQDQNENGLY
jgi:hypothetical protein